MADLPAAKCQLRKSAVYAPEHLTLEKECYQKDSALARDKFSSLAAAVRVREAALAEAVKKAAKP
jgi:hypothetical protein